ncbi:MAG: hypothetical protein AAF891_04655 [Pseudomonadota bacterium]
MTDDKVTVENVNTPGQTTRVDAAKYHDMRSALMKVAPDAPPGLPFGEIKELAKAHLSQDLFPGGKTSGWWGKCVQLDLEAKGILARTKGSPLRFYKT